jgi:putative acetyltransferase
MEDLMKIEVDIVNAFVDGDQGGNPAMCQRMGIGKALIQEGLSRLKDLGAKGCCLVGHPQYYRKFDGGVKSPISALRCISKSLRRTISTPYSSRFARLELGLFSPPSKNLSFYRSIKFGFENVAGIVHAGVPQEVFFALSFDGRLPHGDVTFHEGFKANGQQSHAGGAALPSP